MNYLNVFIFIIATILIATEEVCLFRKPNNLHEWKTKNPNKEKYVNFGKKAVRLYNENNNQMLRFINVSDVQKQNEDNSKHYKLRISADTDCGKNYSDCIKEIGADIFVNKKHPNEISTYVHNY
uniref:Cystatin domain-containing protein n=1 Tax=Strongyloides venezuelensis TaxID=75913 RepID=A0A0K0G4F0_STRVS